MVDQRSPLVEVGILSLWVVSRPFSWSVAFAGYIGTLLFPSSATATKKQQQKTAVESTKLRLEMQTQVETCQVRITVAQRRRDELLESAVTAKRSGDAKTALSCMRKVQEQRKTLDFLEGVLRSTESQMAAVERTEMTQEIIAGQEQVAKVMGKQKFAEKMDDAEDYKATIEEVTEESEELCGILAAGSANDFDDEELMDELLDIELGFIDEPLTSETPEQRPAAAAAAAAAVSPAPEEQDGAEEGEEGEERIALLAQ
jgi:hypothetical protein